MITATTALAGLASATAAIFGTIAEAAAPAPQRGVAQWAQEVREIAAETGTPRPGKWDNAFVPEGVEIMDCLDEAHPAREVVVMGSSQFIKTEIGLNFLGHTITDDPCGVLVVMPSLDEMRLFNSTKFDPMVTATPELANRVLAVVERVGTGSTTSFKKFRGGFISITTASSSKGLQGRSCRKIFGDEVTEWPADVGGRGDPWEQAKTRADAQISAKFLAVSTPGILPDCRINKMYRKGDQRLRFHECPACHTWSDWRVSDLARQPDGSVALVCRACTHPIPEASKARIRAGAHWIKTYEDVDADGVVNEANPAPPELIPGDQIDRWRARGSAGRHPSFNFNQVLSPMKAWSVLLAEADAARAGDVLQRRTFRQQKEGLPFDPASESADADALQTAARAGLVRRGEIPAWAARITIGADVQGDRVTWGAFAWGPGLTGALIDWGDVEGDPTKGAVWAAVRADVLTRKWQGAHTVPLLADGFAVDSGGAAGVTPQVYQFAGALAGVFAVKGDKGQRERNEYWWRAEKPARVKTSEGKTVRCQLYLVANHETKAQISASLRVFEQAAAEGARMIPGGLYLPADLPLNKLRELTAERLEQPRSARATARGQWVKAAGQANELLDCARYAFALNWYQTLGWTPDRWTREFTARARPDQSAPPLLDLMLAQGDTAPAAPAEAAPEAPASNPVAAATVRRFPTRFQIGPRPR